ncbi:hypothetical protein GLOIN_2v1847961 [Rhizophagus irregularis DAOM 181602=DAOM 197198]|nr:hypothetical protein GLOIN_2v1847961 [Rhizophagus irregularis DAOM 181602=DAOM 197198]
MNTVLGLVNFGFKMDPHLKKITDDRYGEDLIDEMEIKDVSIPPKREYDMKMDIDGHFIKECPNSGMKRGNKNIRVRVNIPPEKYVMDMFNEKANITYGQIYNENPKFRKITRDYNGYSNV